jgi:hypothetical protein
MRGERLMLEDRGERMAEARGLSESTSCRWKRRKEPSTGRKRQQILTQRRCRRRSS